MNARELLSTRASNPKLGEPAPSAVELESLFSDALRAPDHGALRPWRILTVRGEARTALGEVFARTLREAEPDALEQKLERLAQKPLRAPLIIVVAAIVEDSPLAPEIEQVLSAGAVAHGILMGLQARGYRGMWRTGPMAYAVSVKLALGLRPADHIVGFVYAGTAIRPTPEAVRPKTAGLVVDWTGD